MWATSTRHRNLPNVCSMFQSFVYSVMLNRMNPFELETHMYSNRHLCIIKENLIKHLYHHREQFLHEACVRDLKALQ